MNIHTLEIKKRIFFCITFFIIIFSILIYFSQILYDMFSIPLKNQLPINGSLITTKITSTFTIPIKLAFFTSIIISFPYNILQLWLFITPGLYENEKKEILPIIILSILFFFIGLLFAFYIISPIAINFFFNYSPTNIKIMISIDNYTTFMITLMLTSALSFQIPLIIKIATKINIISINTLKKKRPYAILMAFILGMILTPPDVISQIILAIPIWLLYEIGIKISK